MSVGFTPGPWDLVTNKFGEHVVAAGDDDIFVLDDTESSVSDHDEYTANARLIAAAPDGHDIAERLVAHLRNDFRIPADADEGWLVDTLGHSLGGIYLDAVAYLARVSGGVA
jgi:hypothetical protein